MSSVNAQQGIAIGPGKSGHRHLRGIRTMATETTAQSSLWVITSLMALLAARRRNFEVHWQWAMRSYAVTLIFVISRILLALPIAPTTDAGAERMTWFLTLSALLVPQLIINRRQLFL